MNPSLSGLQTGSCQLSATFTPDGRHIISASEDSNIYMWNHENQDECTLKQAKANVISSEHFHSNNAVIAIPWNGKTPRNPVSLVSQYLAPQGDTIWSISKASKCNSCQSEEYSSINNSVSKHAAAPVIFNSNQELSNDLTCKSAATWPEEILPLCSIGDILDKSQYKLLRNVFQGTSNLWGQVIVTAGWDGRIRSFQNYGLQVNQ
jgi:WD40 repeat protein